MRNLLCSLLLLGSLYSQDFFKFSTIYGAYSLTSPVTKEQQFQVTGGQLQELQQELDDHSIMTFGIRKLARFGYENKPEVWYTGKEAPINESASIGNVPTGWEYVIEYSDHREFEEEFINQQFMLRYMGDNFIAKANYDYRGLEDVEFAAIDMRLKKDFGNLALSMGVAGRSHPAYLDFRPIDLWWDEQGIDTSESTPFWEFAYFYGYTDEWTEQYTQFGYQYFEGARKRILRLEQELQTNGIPQAKIQDAIGGFVGPIEMMQGNVNAQIPHNRILAPGDKLTLISWSDQTSLKKSTILVDAQGYAILPQVGKLVVRGMTLTQFEKIAQEALSHKQFTDLKVVASFTELHTIQIFITGWVFRPGTYATSSVTSVFNALYLSGGPSESGALRNIHLIRNGETTHIDFYQYLMKGDSSQDIPLVAGDTIYIAPVEKLVEISGEVRRPGAYEVLPDDNFDVLLEMAGNIKPIGFAKRIQINTVLPNEERILREVDVSKKTNPPIFHGDEVLVLPIRDEILNIVHIEGLVKRSGIYELKPGMRIANLIKRAEGLAGEAFSDRADLFRLNEDEKTTVLIPLNLRKALAEDTFLNLDVKSRDRLFFYSKFD